MNMRHQDESSTATAEAALRSLDAAIEKALKAGVDSRDISMLVQKNASNTTNNRARALDISRTVDNEKFRFQSCNQVYRIFLFAVIAFLSIGNMFSIRGSDLLQRFASVDCASKEETTTQTRPPTLRPTLAPSQIVNPPQQSTLPPQESVMISKNERQPIPNISTAIAQSDPFAILQYLFQIPNYDDEEHLGKYRHRHDRVKPTSKNNFTKAKREWEDYSWAKLPENIKEAARLIGYQRSTWDNDFDIPLASTHWNDLTKNQTEAALLLGYDEDDWTPWCPLDTFLAMEHFHQLCDERDGGMVCIYPGGIVKRIKNAYQESEIHAFKVLNDTRFFPKLLYWDPKCSTTIQENVRRPGMKGNTWCASYEYYEAFYKQAFKIFNANNIVPDDLNVWHNTVVNGYDIRIIDFGRYTFSDQNSTIVRAKNKVFLDNLLNDLRDEVSEAHDNPVQKGCGDFGKENGNHLNPEVRTTSRVSVYNARNGTWVDGRIINKDRDKNVWVVKWDRGRAIQNYFNNGTDYMALQQAILDAQRDNDDPPIYSAFKENNGTYVIKWRIDTQYPEKFDTAEDAFLALRKMTLDLRKSKKWSEYVVDS